MRNATLVILTILFYGCSTTDPVYYQQLSSADTAGELRIEILSPSQNQHLQGGLTSVVVEGGASNFGGVRYLDLIFVLDSSNSLERTDPNDYRSQGAAGLVESLSQQSDIQIGVVGFDRHGRLLSPLTADRSAAIASLAGLGRNGGTDIAIGIRTALREFDSNAREDASRVILLFTDGKSNANKARQAMAEAVEQGVAVHTLLLGSSERGAAILQEIAHGTGASFIQVLDPSKLPEAFLDLRTTGVDSVSLEVNDGEPIPARLVGGTFSARVTLQPGPNNIVAIATGLNGSKARTMVSVEAGPPNCASLEVRAERNGLPTISINERSIEIVVDASNSMWGRMEGLPKMSIAKKLLEEASSWFPSELQLGLRAYGHSSFSEMKDCTDSKLLVAIGDNNREQIRQAIAGLNPKGQTPLAYALNQVAADFGNLPGERAVMLVTDGIESCGGDPVAAARALHSQGIKVNVIGFGLGNMLDEDTESLSAVAEAAGGRFILAHSTEDLKEALAGTVGTPFEVFQGQTVVAQGALGSNEPILLPQGDYRVLLHSSPPEQLAVRLMPGERVTMTLEKTAGFVSHSEQRYLEGYMACPVPDQDQTLRASR